jgi:hypothetical protein
VRDEQTGWIELHAGEFFLLWHALGFGELPAMLGVPSFGRTPAAREQWRDAASASLDERGLGTVDKPAEDLAALLRAVGWAELVLELQVDTPSTALRGLGVTGPEGTAALARVDTTVRVGPADRTDLVQTMLAVPPALGPGHGMSANLPVADYTAACAAGVDGGVGGFVSTLGRLGVRPEECLTLSRALSTRVAGGRLTARVIDARGQWQRSSATVGWLDAEDGRYALRVDGEWLTVTPVDHHRLVTMGQELLATVS